MRLVNELLQACTSLVRTSKLVVATLQPCNHNFVVAQIISFLATLRPTYSRGEPEDDSRRGTPLHFLCVEEEIARRCSNVLLGDA